jgi:hypothetical protein
MTLSLCIGSIEKKFALVDGQVVERDVIHLNISVDHDIIDGAPLVRFANRLKKRALTAGAVSRGVPTGAAAAHLMRSTTAPSIVGGQVIARAILEPVPPGTAKTPAFADPEVRLVIFGQDRAK